jgi:hypothetical protein
MAEGRPFSEIRTLRIPTFGGALKTLYCMIFKPANSLKCPSVSKKRPWLLPWFYRIPCNFCFFTRKIKETRIGQVTKKRVLDLSTPEHHHAEGFSLLAEAAMGFLGCTLAFRSFFFSASIYALIILLYAC